MTEHLVTLALRVARKVWNIQGERGPEPHHRCQRWDEHLHTLHLDERDAMQLIEDRVAQYQIISPGQVIMCFSDYPTFRHGIFQDYKANRIGKRKPLGLRNIRDRITKEFHSISFNGLEGDDVMGLLATGQEYKNPVIVSPDKDMKLIE